MTAASRPPSVELSSRSLTSSTAEPSPPSSRATSRASARPAEISVPAENWLDHGLLGVPGRDPRPRGVTRKNRANGRSSLAGDLGGSARYAVSEKSTESVAPLRAREPVERRRESAVRARGDARRHVEHDDAVRAGRQQQRRLRGIAQSDARTLRPPRRARTTASVRRTRRVRAARSSEGPRVRERDRTGRHVGLPCGARRQLRDRVGGRREGAHAMRVASAASGPRSRSRGRRARRSAARRRSASGRPADSRTSRIARASGSSAATARTPSHRDQEEQRDEQRCDGDRRQVRSRPSWGSCRLAGGTVVSARNTSGVGAHRGGATRPSTADDVGRPRNGTRRGHEQRAGKDGAQRPSARSRRSRPPCTRGDGRAG